MSLLLIMYITTIPLVLDVLIIMVHLVEVMVALQMKKMKTRLKRLIYFTEPKMKKYDNYE